MSDRPPALQAASSPHLVEPAAPTTATAMRDVLIGLLPATAAALYLFGRAAAIPLGATVAACLTTEAACGALRGRPVSLRDGSALLTGLILGLSLPPGTSVHAAVVGGVVAIGLGKAVFGGLGNNPFNPAMVGRAFLMACFPAGMTAWREPLTLDAVTGATPLAAARFGGEATDPTRLLTGEVAGCIGETSAIALIAGGLFILLRGVADWRLCAGMLAPIAAGGALERLVRGAEVAPLGPHGHLLAGGALLAAFFIVTDPVTSPLSRKARWLYALAVGGLVMVIRLFGGYPEGVMYAVLIGNAIAPLLDRVTVPRPVGGRVEPPPAPAASGRIAV